MRLGRLLHSAGFHKWATFAWTALLVPWWLWWRDSVVFVGIVSIYANIVGHWSSYQAARAEEKKP